MSRDDLLLDSGTDRVLQARPYFTADQLEEVRDNKARELQCFLRQCFAWRRVQRLREEKEHVATRELQLHEENAKSADAEHKAQIHRRMHPRSAADFSVLTNELERWRLHETVRIKAAAISEEQKQRELAALLAKEVKLLQTIDRLKITSHKANTKQRIKEVLEKMASPKEWTSAEGDLVEVETPFTTRAKELVELYSGLMLTDSTPEERADILLHVKYTVDEFDCQLTRDILDLIAREEDLMRRGRPAKSFVGLRKRLGNLFLQFVETPEFNPEAANFSRAPFIDINTSKLPYIRTILRETLPTIPSQQH
jgi:hypothetical protein